MAPRQRTQTHQTTKYLYFATIGDSLAKEDKHCQTFHFKNWRTCSILDPKYSTNLGSVFQSFMEMGEFLMAYSHFQWHCHKFMWKYSFACWLWQCFAVFKREWNASLTNWIILKGIYSSLMCDLRVQIGAPKKSWGPRFLVDQEIHCLCFP